MLGGSRAASGREGRSTVVGERASSSLGSSSRASAIARTWVVEDEAESIGESEYCVGVLGRESSDDRDRLCFVSGCLEPPENQRSTGNAGCGSSRLGGLRDRLEPSEGMFRDKDIAERLCVVLCELLSATLEARGDGVRVRACLMLSWRTTSTECRDEDGSEIKWGSDLGCW